jgi:glycosyltransferase involved in cell wall biosynthesis
MKVAIIGDYPRDPNYVQGGVEAVVHNLVEKLSDMADLELDVVNLREDLVTPQTLTRRGVTIHYLPASHLFGNVTFFLINKIRLVQALRRIRPDVVHAHVAGEYADAAQLSGHPAVLTLHGIRHRATWLKSGWLNRHVRRPLIEREERHSVRQARHLIAISPYVQQEFAREIRGQVYAVENPVRDQFFGLPATEVPGRILFAGHVDRNKSLHHLVQALPPVRGVCAAAHVHVAGAPYEDDYWRELQADLARLGMAAHVHFLGQLSEAQLLQQYAKCALLVLPSRQETAPMVIQQAMAAGKPVVASRVGGIPYLVEPETTGYLVDYGDVLALAEAVSRLLVDPARRAHFGEQARQAARARFHAGLVAQRTLGVYQNVLSG